VRRAVEVAFEVKTGGELPLAVWMMKEHKAGRSLRQISDDLAVKTGVRVSHETVRQWMIEG